MNSLSLSLMSWLIDTHTRPRLRIASTETESRGSDYHPQCSHPSLLHTEAYGYIYCVLGYACEGGDEQEQWSRW